MVDKKEMTAKQRRRSSTTSRLAAMVAGQSGHVVRRHRGSSYQAGDDSPLVPDNLSPGAMGSRRHRSGARGGAGSALCTRNRLCKAALGLLLAVLLYLVFLGIFTTVNTEDPCEVAQRNLRLVTKSGTDRTDMPADWSPTVPKIIHQQWKSKTVSNEKYQAWQARWKEFFPEPEYTHILWTDESQRELIAEHYPWFLEYYDDYKFDIQRADSVRYFIMYHMGGVYADLDYEPIREFWGHLAQDRVSLIESPYLYNELVQNSLMASPQRDPFWSHAFKKLVSEYRKPILSATGPVFLDTVVKTNPEPFHKLPCENFHRIPLGEQENSPFLTLLHREVLGRIFPMKQCGEYTDPTCQLGKHHNTASYLKDTGLLRLVFA